MFYGLLSRLGLLLRMFCFLCFTSTKRNKLYYTGDELTSHAVVFGVLVLPPPHKRLLTQAPHSFPIVLLPKHPSQSPSSHCPMVSNQIAGYNGRFRLPRALYSLWYMWVLRDEGAKLEYIYIFFTSEMAGRSWNAKTNIEFEYKRFLCDVFSWETQNLGESVIDLPRLIELTVGKDITSYRCGNSGADLFVCTKCHKETYLIRESKEECRRYQGEICSIYQSIKDY